MYIERTRFTYIGLITIYALLSFSFLAPIASNIALPPMIDDYAHTSLVVQGALALNEGQFPIRVAPTENSGFGYPEFQFYSPLTYTLAGSVYKLITHANPFLALKITVWFFLILGALYIYGITKQITLDNSASIIAGATYLASPYLLINLIARGDFNEVIGQCLLAIVLYYSFQIYLKTKVTYNNLLMAGLSWSMLAMVHLITFVNASIIFFLFFIFYKTEHYVKKLLYIGLAYFISLLLSAWYLIPIVLYQSKLNISNALINPITYNYLTLISRLCSVVSTAVFSSASYSRTGFDTILSPPFYPAVGLITLLAVGLCCYLLWINPEKISSSDKKLVKILVIMFFLSVFITWSPFNFWKYFPKILVIEQFSYRFLAQVNWIGALLVAIAIKVLTNRKNALQVIIIGLVFICVSSSSWLMAKFNYSAPLPSIIVSPNVAVSGMVNIPGITDVYLMKPTLNLNNKITNIPLVMDHKMVKMHCNKIKAKLNCQFSTRKAGLFEFPIIYYPKLLNVEVDGYKVSYFPSKFQNYYLTAINLTPGTHTIIIKFVGIVWANWVSFISWFGLLMVGMMHLMRIYTRIKNIILPKPI